MKNVFLATMMVSILFGCGTSDRTIVESATPKMPPNPEIYANTITEQELKDMLYIYASDEFEGRETGEPGQKMAVNYLKEQYMTMGIPSPLDGDDYFQEVPLQKQGSPEVELLVNGQSFINYDDFLVSGSADTQTMDITEVVYAGYGIDSKNYSDYTDIDVKDKIVLIRQGEPKNTQGNFVTSNSTEDTKWSSGRQELSSKRDAAKARGVKALLILNPDLLTQYGTYYKQMQTSGSGARISIKSNESEMVSVLVGTALAEAIYPEINSAETAKNITTNLNISIDSQSEEVSSENVVAYIKGSEKPDEILVISAHLDHEGIKNGQVYNGADDDGSGTIALLEIAEAFKQAEKEGNGPKRSILFLHVTGEEKGLLGSKYYADNDPVFPLKNTIADLNIDMIGRTDPKREGDRNYIYLIGSDKLSTELHNISEEQNLKYTNITLDYKYNDENDPNRFYYRSDHYNFAKNNIPVIFYFNGTHADYHQPSDTPDKIQYDLLENRTKLVFYTAWELANRAERLTVDKVE